MKFNKYIMLLVLSFHSILFAQAALQIDGPEGTVGYGEIAELETNVEIKIDADGKPSHSIIWKLDEPRELRSKVKIYNDGTLLAIPTGCKPQTVYVSVQVIDWENRKVETKDFEFKIGNENNPPPDEPDPLDPPDSDNPAKDDLKEALKLVPQASKDKYAKGVVSNLNKVISEFESGEYGPEGQLDTFKKLSSSMVKYNTDLYGTGTEFKNWSKFWVAVQGYLTKEFEDNVAFDVVKSLKLIVAVLEDK